MARETHAFTLFATHFFEMTGLPKAVEGVQNVHLDALEVGDDLVFMHAVKDGPANRSYGLQVARRAGVPAVVIRRAGERLAELNAVPHRPPAAITHSSTCFPNVPCRGRSLPCSHWTRTG